MFGVFLGSRRYRSQSYLPLINLILHPLFYSFSIVLVVLTQRRIPQVDRTTFNIIFR